jgi:hypothetical protein
MERREFWGYAYLIMAAAIGGTLWWRWDQVLVFNRGFEFALLVAGGLALALIAGPFVLIVAKLAKTPFLSAWADTTLAIGLMLLFIHAFYLYETTSPANLAAAKAYAKIAQPALERYYSEHHSYPRTLSELKLPGTVPFGFSYQATDSGPIEWGMHLHEVIKGDTASGPDYLIEYGDWYFLGDDRWELGGI